LTSQPSGASRLAFDGRRQRLAGLETAAEYTLGLAFPSRLRATGVLGTHSGARYAMQLRSRATAVLCLATLLVAVPASAQYGARRRVLSDPATGETYHVEIGGSLWNPTPTILIRSESLGIIGDQIDFIEDFQIEKATFKQLKVVLRPGRKHKLRFEFTPIRYSNDDARLRRSIIFNGQRFDVALPVATELKWNAIRYGYEWDFVYRDRGFVGLLLDLKQTNVEASIENIFVGREFISAKAPIPAIGIIGRGYVAPNVSITGEFSGFKLPDFDEDYKGKYFDFDFYGTVNFSDHFGAQAGYRSLTVFYKVESDQGDLKIKGLYFGGVARF
jgi:hypothetical protein